MTTNQTEFGGSDEAALAYIRMRGYCSYSSMVNVRDKKVPEKYVEKPYFTFGKELHSRFLEHKKLITLDETEELMLKKMINNLADDPIVCSIMKGAKCEVDFDLRINGLRVFGRIDILTFAVGDLKSTHHNAITPFIHSMDFLQAALYRRATKLKDFYYIGSSKMPPYNVMVFNVNQYPILMERADTELDYLITYIKKKL